jgi:hypothetical protein
MDLASQTDSGCRSQFKEDGMSWEQGLVWCGCHGAKVQSPLCVVPLGIAAGSENQEMLIAFAEIIKREFPSTKQAQVCEPCSSGHIKDTNMKLH